MLQGLLLCLMVSASIGALVSDSFAAIVAAIATGTLACAAALALMVAQLAAYRRNARPEHRPILLRFIGALVSTWLCYPIVFLLGPGIVAALDTATTVTAFALLDLFAKNAFVMWVWAASSRMLKEEHAAMRLVLSHGEPVHCGGVIRDTPPPPLQHGPGRPAQSPQRAARQRMDRPPKTDTVGNQSGSLRPNVCSGARSASGGPQA